MPSLSEILDYVASSHACQQVIHVSGTRKFEASNVSLTRPIGTTVIHFLPVAHPTVAVYVTSSLLLFFLLAGH
jgi:hypothetical protein